MLVKICSFPLQTANEIDYSDGKSDRIVRQSLRGFLCVCDCLGGLCNLRVLVLGHFTNVDDNFVDVLARNAHISLSLMPDLLVYNSAADLGLDFLSECKKLR